MLPHFGGMREGDVNPDLRWVVKSLGGMGGRA